jgi:hypothetical protein
LKRLKYASEEEEVLKNQKITTTATTTTTTIQNVLVLLERNYSKLVFLKPLSHKDVDF